jgi:hypothetical protein
MRSILAFVLALWMVALPRLVAAQAEPPRL